MLVDFDYLLHWESKQNRKSMVSFSFSAIDPRNQTENKLPVQFFIFCILSGFVHFCCYCFLNFCCVGTCIFIAKLFFFQLTNIRFSLFAAFKPVFWVESHSRLLT